MQNIDVLGNRRARAILANCAIKVLMGPPTPGLRETFGLSESEEDEMSTFGIGDALMITPDKRILLHYQASELEHRLSTTHHQEVAQMREQHQVLITPEVAEGVGGADGSATNVQASAKPNTERRRRTRTSRPNQQGERLTEKQPIFHVMEEGEGGQT